LYILKGPESISDIINENQETTMSKVTKNKILEQLSPMYNVILEQDKNGRTFIVKEGLKFGFIKDKNLYLINDSGEFVQQEKDRIASPDGLLFEATKSFWSARALKLYEKA
jgi:hypothetical protein